MPFGLEVDMPIKLEIPDDFFTQSERENLMYLLNARTDQEFASALIRVTFAALDEYRDMFLGMGLPSRANEIREFRLYHLIKRYFQGRIPDEFEVASMFQLPVSRSKNLITNVLARFRFDLEDEIFNTLRTIIESAEDIDEGREYRVFIQSSNMVDELNRVIARSGVRYRTVTKVRNEPNQYAIAPDSHDLIRQYLGIVEE